MYSQIEKNLKLNNFWDFTFFPKIINLQCLDKFDVLFQNVWSKTSSPSKYTTHIFSIQFLSCSRNGGERSDLKVDRGLLWSEEILVRVPPTTNGFPLFDNTVTHYV
jgi:hypothetical protein